MLDILLKVGYLMALTFVIGFIIAFIIKLIVVLINFSGDIHKYDRKYLKEIQRARSIKKIRFRRLYRDSMNNNDEIKSDDHFGLKKPHNSNELIDFYYGK